MPGPILALAVSRYLEENNATQDTITTVESVRYSNPMDLVLYAGMVTTVVVFRAIRDWAARLRLDAALATEVENTVLARKKLRDEINRRIIQDGIPISPTQVDDLLTLDVARAMSALGDAQFTMRELESGDDKPEHG